MAVLHSVLNSVLLHGYMAVKHGQ